MNKTNFKLETTNDSAPVEKENQSWLEQEVKLTKVRFRLNSAINDPEYYNNLLERLEMMSENDCVEVVIDSVGGDLDGCIALCDAFQNTDAFVTGILVNKAFSAGACIALCCNNLEVRPNARMMLHSYSGGFTGKDHEIDLDYNFNKTFIRKFFANCCEGFLTEEELQQMYDGKDWWFNAEDIIERLKKRQDYFQEKYEENLDDEDLEDCCNCKCGKDCGD